MQIKVYGEEKLVRSVLVQQSMLGYSILINTRDRFPVFQDKGASPRLIGHYCFSVLNEIYDKEGNLMQAEECEIVLMPETEEETVGIFNGLRYEMREKDQIVVEFIRRSFLLARTFVCNWDGKVSAGITCEVLGK